MGVWRDGVACSGSLEEARAQITTLEMSLTQHQQKTEQAAAALDTGVEAHAPESSQLIHRHRVIGLGPHPSQ